MEEKLIEDFGEEIIAQLKELNLILDKIKEEKENSQECPFAHSCKYRISKLSKK